MKTVALLLFTFALAAAQCDLYIVDVVGNVSRADTLPFGIEQTFRVECQQDGDFRVVKHWRSNYGEEQETIVTFSHSAHFILSGIKLIQSTFQLTVLNGKWSNLIIFILTVFIYFFILFYG